MPAPAPIPLLPRLPSWTTYVCPCWGYPIGCWPLIRVSAGLAVMTGKRDPQVFRVLQKSREEESLQTSRGEERVNG